MFLQFWIALFIQQQHFTFATVSFNQPTFRTNTTTLATQSYVGTYPFGIFVNQSSEWAGLILLSIKI